MRRTCRLRLPRDSRAGGDRPCAVRAGCRPGTGLTQALVDCDVAIVAGGVTLYEACALGTPAVGLAVVPAQRRAIVEFASRGAVVDAGLASDLTIERAARYAAQLLGDERRRRATAARARKLVDGLGARRAAEHIRALLARGAQRIA